MLFVTLGIVSEIQNLIFLEKSVWYKVFVYHKDYRMTVWSGWKGP